MSKTQGKPKQGKRSYETFFKHMDSSTPKGKAFSKCFDLFVCIDYSSKASTEKYWQGLENGQYLGVPQEDYKAFEISLKKEHWFLESLFHLPTEFERFERFLNKIAMATSGWDVHHLPDQPTFLQYIRYVDRMNTLCIFKVPLPEVLIRPIDQHDFFRKYFFSSKAKVQASVRPKRYSLLSCHIGRETVHQEGERVDCCCQKNAHLGCRGPNAQGALRKGPG
jgi:hypothetical protein